MLHEMHLNENPFNNIKDGLKKIELRVYDEKRKKINIGDVIVITCRTDSNKILKIKVIGILIYKSFNDIYNDIDYMLFGPCESSEKSLENLYNYYSKDEEEKYGVIGISFEVL